MPGTRGDANGDGSVDAADYAVWRDHLGTMNPGSGAVSAAEEFNVAIAIVEPGTASNVDDTGPAIASDQSVSGSPPSISLFTTLRAAQNGLSPHARLRPTRSAIAPRAYNGPSYSIIDLAREEIGAKRSIFNDDHSAAIAVGLRNGGRRIERVDGMDSLISSRFDLEVGLHSHRISNVAELLFLGDRPSEALPSAVTSARFD